MPGTAAAGRTTGPLGSLSLPSGPLEYLADGFPGQAVLHRQGGARDFRVLVRIGDDLFVAHALRISVVSNHPALGKDGVGLLRLLTNAAVMGDQTLTLRKAWAVYDRWLEDPRVEFNPEPRNIDLGFRQTLQPFASKPATKWVGDGWLLAFAKGTQATLVTFDRGLYEFARKQGHAVTIPE